MFSIAIPELIILLIIIILLFGPDRICRRIRGFRKSLQGQSQTAVGQEPPEDRENKSNGCSLNIKNRVRLGLDFLSVQQSF